MAKKNTLKPPKSLRNPENATMSQIAAHEKRLAAFAEKKKKAEKKASEKNLAIKRLKTKEKGLGCI